MSVQCPTCGDDSFDDETGMKIHHKLSHGESLAMKQAECVQCGDEFEYYPSNRNGRLCHECSDRFGDTWGDSMKTIWQKQGANPHNRREVKKRRVNQIKERVGCQHCGYDEHVAALEFHHIDEKTASIASMTHRGYKWEELLAELRKCIVVCANCHKIEHS